MVLQYKLANFLGQNDKFHIARVNIGSADDITQHYHDYAELLWIENGSAWHIINGERIKLCVGDLVMIRPSDVHTFDPMNKHFTLINIAFETALLDHFHNRYFENSKTFFG